MIVQRTKIDGVYVVIPEVHEDSRGYFMESFHEEIFNVMTGADFHPVQDNESKSCYGVLRGLHFQREPHAQAKLVRVIKGTVMDVAVDLRPDSETRGSYVAVILSEKNRKQLFIPKGFAHGFIVLSDEAVFQYKCDDYYHPECEDGIQWDDPTVDVQWLLPPDEIILSEKDRKRKAYEELKY
jgi:dTDP-4-dehydrorhamnose 3,5-epimerase